MNFQCIKSSKHEAQSPCCRMICDTTASLLLDTILGTQTDLPFLSLIHLHANGGTDADDVHYEEFLALKAPYA